MPTSLQQRLLDTSGVDPDLSVRVERGDRRDYDRLAAHHYCAGPPATATRVLRLVHERVGVVGRFTDRRSERRCVGVLVESMPTLHCAMRDWALAGRLADGLSGAQRGMMIRRELRSISRVVVDPQWRGLGLAVRLVREALGSATTVYTEALAAMGKVNPFFEKAGMVAYEQPLRPCDQRLIAAMRHVQLSDRDLGMLDRLEAKLAALDPLRRDWLERELVRWCAHRRAGRSKALSIGERWVLAQRSLLRQPVYYLAHNRDVDC